MRFLMERQPRFIDRTIQQIIWELRMTIDVIGAGFGRTGTLSLKFALEALGLDKCYHMMEVMRNQSHAAQWRKAARGEAVDWNALYAGYQATVDWPSASSGANLGRIRIRRLMILTLRDCQQWYASVMNTIWKFSSNALAESRKRQDDQGIERSSHGR